MFNQLKYVPRPCILYRDKMEKVMLTFLLLIPFMTWSHQQIQFPQDDGRTKEATMLGLAEKRRNHNMLPVVESKLWSVSSGLTNKEDIESILDNILIRRVSGTPANVQVRDYIINRMQNLGWTVKLDQFDDNTPLGVTNFANIIATHNPNAERFLVLACHYDSKLFQEFEFVGAVDSAVPCAMMLNLANTLQLHLNARSNAIDPDVGLMFIFFDGEEAFVEWTATDSLYGSRHLAAEWEKEGMLPRIDLFVLLDLLGTPNPRFYSYFDETNRWYERLSDCESRLSRLGVLEKYGYNSAHNVDLNELYFQPFSYRVRVDDDHVPFLKRNVPVIHVIPSPFPEVWHTSIDDRKAVDMTTVENLQKIFRVFVLEYLNIAVD